MTPYLRASLIAPLTTPVLYWAGSYAAAFADPARRAWAGHNMWRALVTVCAVGGPVAYAATFAAALPALWLLRRLGPLSMGRCVVVGGVVGLVVAIVLAPWLRGDLISVPLAPWQGALLGAASAAVWWWLARPAPAARGG